MPSFPLTTEPWIHVWDLDTDGGRDVGLAEALTRAHRLRFAALRSEDLPVLRVLAALYDAACGPTTNTEWDAAWTAETLDTGAITAYLDQWGDRLDLFHSEHPAFQAAGLTDYNRGPASLHPGSLAGDAGAWFNPVLRTPDGVRPWEPADAARYLLHLNAYDPAGIKGAAPGDPAARNNKVYGGQISPLAGVTHAHLRLPGNTIKELLLANLPPQPRTPGDAPVWERDSPGVSMRVRSATGRLDLLTWPARRIRLHATDEGLVDAVAHYDGDRLADAWEDVASLDPMTAWFTSRAGTPAPFQVLDIEGSSCPWRPAALLDASASWGALQHLAAAAERGVLAQDLAVQAVMSSVVYSNRHRATISDITLATMPICTTGQLADPGARMTLAMMSRYTDAVAADLRKHAIRISGRPSARVEHRTLFTDLERDWQAAVDLSADDLEGARTQWHRAIAEAADSCIDSLSLRPFQAEELRVAYRARPDAAYRSSKSRITTAPTPSAAGDKPRRRPGPATERYDVFGGRYSLSEIAQRSDCAVSYKTLRDRVRDGWTVEKAATTPGRRGRPRDSA
ncbi:type I-E CRISPR-associated protein Cse1/CasA [Streptomyces sp. NPDC006640]|uniref:type I-E CRISPR-associated protein Cse1/CasA n=1 Tax=unclassified Streptomyces TaxID=2593676 RepID=UPI0036796097